MKTYRPKWWWSLWSKYKISIFTGCFPRLFASRLHLPLIINFPVVLLSSASNMYLPSSSYLADFTTRMCLFPSTRSSNLSSFDNSWDPFSQRKLLGSLEISSSNFASSFSYTCTSASGVRNETGSSVGSDRLTSIPRRSWDVHEQKLWISCDCVKITRET